MALVGGRAIVVTDSEEAFALVRGLDAEAGKIYMWACVSNTASVCVLSQARVCVCLLIKEEFFSGS